MPIETATQSDSVEIRFRRDRGGVPARIAGQAAGWGGAALLLLPALTAGPRDGLAFAAVAGITVVLLVLAWRLLAEASRRDGVRASLHLPSGELTVVEGRGVFSRERAVGAVEAERFVLGRTPRDDRHFYHLLLVTRFGPPVMVVGFEEDEVGVREAGLLLSRGMDLPLEDRRYVHPGTGAPDRVARFAEERRTVFLWDYRDRFHPRATLGALGGSVAILCMLPALVRPLGTTLVLPALLALLCALGVTAHALICLTSRRVTLRTDALRVERRLWGLSLSARMVPLDHIAAVVVGRGPFARLRVRGEGRWTGGALPFEEPALAGWLKMLIERAVHDSAKARGPLA